MQNGTMETMTSGYKVTSDNNLIFSQTVTGYSHKLNELICQDDSGVMIDEGRKCIVIAVADGHGDPLCARSDRGSEFAVKAATECLMEFGGWCCDNPEYARGLEDKYRCRVIIRKLTDAIIASWSDKVESDLAQDPYDAGGEQMDNQEYIYGTTLLAAVKTPDNLIVVQQGDGTCCVLLRNGEMIKPVPSDEECIGNITTSLCDNDVPVRIRSCTIDDPDEKIAACFIGTDGIEDSFADENELFAYYNRLMANMTCKSGQEDDMNLEDELSRLSKTGSGDDMSVAGIINIYDKGEFLKAVNKTIQENEATNRIDELDAKLISMQRKDTYLKEEMRRNRTPESITRYREYHSEYKALEKEKKKLIRMRKLKQLIGRRKNNDM